MMDFPILSSLICLPLLGALYLLFVIRGSEEIVAVRSRYAAFWTSMITFGVSVLLWFKYDINARGFQFEEYVPWFQDYHIGYHLGIDGISIFFILLTTLLIPICILASWQAITNRVREYMVAFLVLESLVVGVFCALDFLLFYLFFEAMLIPMFLIIGIWGGDNRIYAAFKFFLYTLAGSVLLLLAILYIYNHTGTMDIPLLMEKVPSFTLEVQKWLWLALFVSFAVKVPMWPVHTWLPDAHVQAPTAGSVILAGILLKMGGYGFLRFSLPMLPAASHYFADLVFYLSIAAVIYASLVALMQQDMKKLIAYSSIAHMGFVTAGIFAFNQYGLQGSMIQMLSHGLVSAALFLCVGVLYDRMHTREIARYGGVVKNMPVYAFVFMFFMMASIGLPSTSGFVGEILVMLGVFQVNKLFAALIALGVILGAAYMLWLYARVVFGEASKPEVLRLSDLTWREKGIFAPLLILVLIMGCYPSFFTDVLKQPLAHLQSQLALQDVASIPTLFSWLQ